MIIDQAAYDAMITHMREAAPREGVGLLAGPEGAPRGVDPPVMVAANGRNVHAWYGVVDRWVPLRNTAEFPRARYEVDGPELVAAWEALDADGRRPWVQVHSHVRTSAAPSDLDIRYAVDPSLLHMVVSLGGMEVTSVLWRLDPNGQGPNRCSRVRYQVVDLGFKAISPTDLTRGVSDRSV